MGDEAAPPGQFWKFEVFGRGIGKKEKRNCLATRQLRFQVAVWTGLEPFILFMLLCVINI